MHQQTADHNVRLSAMKFEIGPHDCDQNELSRQYEGQFICGMCLVQTFMMATVSTEISGFITCRRHYRSVAFVAGFVRGIDIQRSDLSPKYKM